MTVMTVTSLPKDKPKIAAHAAMMFVQNFGFMLLYFSIWGETPFDETCNSTRFAVGYMTLSCFCVAFLCIGFSMGGYVDDACLFATYWIIHALVAVPGYSYATYLIPAARFSDEGAEWPAPHLLLSTASASSTFSICTPRSTLCMCTAWSR